MEERLPEAFEQLRETMERLERHYRDVQDIEFTVEDGRLFLLQTRSAKRTAAAALKAAVSMAEEVLISREEAVSRAMTESMPHTTPLELVSVTAAPIWSVLPSEEGTRGDVWVWVVVLVELWASAEPEIRASAAAPASQVFTMVASP